MRQANGRLTGFRVAAAALLLASSLALPASAQIENNIQVRSRAVQERNDSIQVQNDVHIQSSVQQQQNQAVPQQNIQSQAVPQKVKGVSRSEMEYLSQGVVEDWSTRHVIFSNPGTLDDARRNGREAEWRRIVSDPRYRMQWVRRYAGAWLEENGISQLQGSSVFARILQAGRERDKDRGHGGGGEKHEESPLHADWAVALGPSGATASVAADMHPAKFTFNPLFAPDCTNDFVVFPVAGAASTAANIVGVRNLYTGTCSGTTPTVFFAYNVGTGSVQTSPVLSLDGTKVAFIESRTSGASIFHVLTLDKSGGAGNGTPTSPAVPGTNNSAVDTKVTISLNGSTNGPITRSSPFVDYTNDIAYFGDDNGNLHKITSVFGRFGGTPAEVVISGYWPACTGSFSSSCGSAPVLASPVVDGCATTGSSSPAPTCPGGTYGSGLMIIGGNNGKLYGDPSSYGGYSGLSGIGGYNFASKAATVGSTVMDAPILDGTLEKVFVPVTTTGSNLAVAQLSVSSTASSSTSSNPFVSTTPVTATMGASGTDAFDGAFDNKYLSSTGGTGFMYFCGNLTGAATPALWRVAITNGTMSSANDGNSFQLVASGNTGTSHDCTPLTEFFNSTSNIDYLFVGVKNHGAPSGCGGTACVMSFSLPTGSSTTFPTAPMAASNIGGTLGANGISGFIIDNSSSLPGAAEIYFGNLQAGTGVQVSQSALQ